MIRPTVLTRGNFRSDEDWIAVQDAAVEFEALSQRPQEVHIPSRYVFEDLKIVPSSFRRDLLGLVAGTHDPAAQTFVNSILPVKVFNLSITSPEVIDATHERMAEVYHSDGGAWSRRDMPRTSFVFLNAEEGLSPKSNLKRQNVRLIKHSAHIGAPSRAPSTLTKSTGRPTTHSLVTSKKSHNKWLNASIQTTASWHGSISSITIRTECAET